jgi:hypothetical protein
VEWLYVSREKKRRRARRFCGKIGEKWLSDGGMAGQWIRLADARFREMGKK